MPKAAKKTESVKEDVGKVGSCVKAGVINSLKGINEIEAEIVRLVRVISNAVRATGSVANDGVEIAKDVAGLHPAVWCCRWRSDPPAAACERCASGVSLLLSLSLSLAPPPPPPPLFCCCCCSMASSPIAITVDDAGNVAAAAGCRLD